MTTVTVPATYKPTEKEKYMNPVMLEYFRHKLGLEGRDRQGIRRHAA